MGFLITALCLISPTLVWAQSSPEQNMTLSRAVSIAVEKNPSFLETKEVVNQTADQVPVVRSAILPNLNFLATAGTKQDATNSTPKFNGQTYNVYGSDLKLTQPLFQYGSLSAIDAAKKDVEISRFTSKIAHRDLISTVVQNYYNIVLASRNLETLLRQQKIVNESLSTAQKRYKIGRGQLLDVLQVKTQLALLSSQVVDVRNQVEIAAATLANSLSEPQTSQFKIKNSLNVPALKRIDQAVNPEQGEILELRRNLVSLTKIDDQKSVLLGQNLPSLNLTADYFYNSNSTSELYSSSANSWQAGVELVIPIFSGLSSVYQRRSLVSQHAQLEFEKTNLQDQVDLQQISSRKKLETAMQSILSGEEALKLAKASSDEASKNYRLATVDFLQFLSVQKDYVQAEQSLNQYRYNYIGALVTYYSAYGQEMDGLIGLMEEANR